VAAISHSLCIVVIILVAAPLVQAIPLAVLGGVLVMTALKMIDHARIIDVMRAHPSELVVLVLTAVITVAADLVAAIEVGLLVAGILALRSVATGSGAIQEEVAEHHDGPLDETRLLSEHIAIYRLDGALIFAAAPRFEADVASVEGVSVVILRLRGLTLIGASGAEALARIIDELDQRGITVLIKGARSEHDRALGSSASWLSAITSSTTWPLPQRTLVATSRGLASTPPRTQPEPGTRSVGATEPPRRPGGRMARCPSARPRRVEAGSPSCSSVPLRE
jgi:SulP family sulfate permease